MQRSLGMLLKLVLWHLVIQFSSSFQIRNEGLSYMESEHDGHGGFFYQNQTGIVSNETRVRLESFDGDVLTFEVEHGQKFSLYCEGNSSEKKFLSWTSNSFEQERINQMTTKPNKNLGKCENTENITDCAVMRIINASGNNVGLYTCQYQSTENSIIPSSESQSIYVYVKDPVQLHAIQKDQIFIFQSVLEIEDFIIGCKPSHPDVKVILNKYRNSEKEPLFDVDRVSFDPKVGFKIHNASNKIDNGLFECYFKYNDHIQKAKWSIDVIQRRLHHHLKKRSKINIPIFQTFNEVNFFILSMPRSGSTPLTEIFDSNPHVSLGVGSPEYLNPKVYTIPNSNEEILIFINKKMNEHKPEKQNILAKGFKIFPGHLKMFNIHFDKLVEYLGIKVIFVLWRNDTISSVVSEMIGYQTGVWYQGNKKVKQGTYHLKPEGMELLINNLSINWQVAFKNWPMGVEPHFLSYESLFENTTSVTKRLLETVCVKETGKESPGSKKQNPGSLEQKVSNWDSIPDWMKTYQLDVPKLFAHIQPNIQFHIIQG